MRKILRLAAIAAVWFCFLRGARGADDIVIADFEGASYPAGWTTTGTAFGAGPAKGALPDQQPVSGFVGQRLINSYLHGDDSTGTLLSPPFAIERDYLNFRLGGGNHPGETCMNLLLDEKIVRTASGGDDEMLEPRTWDLRPFRGKSARVEIIDNAKGRWGHINVDQIVQSDTPSEPADIEGGAPPAVYHERYRPQFHFSPAKGWMNDPNGLVFFEGEYHLFFQHRGDVLHQTPVMSWGHAVSTDLVHWTELPIALGPDDHDGWIWSGSAVVDWNNTSGFGQDGKPALVAMYTAAKDPFAQAIAYSIDRGRTWTKFAGNPVIGHIAGQNRDPKVIWYEPSKRWVMALYKDEPDTFCLFASPDLKTWTQLQDLHLPGCNECPDFFPLALEGDKSKTRWVFTGANGKYLVGDFDGKTFTPQGSVKQVDFGRNYYAVQTFSDIPASDGRRIQIAWMAGGKYPRMPFNQQMSFPAVLTLRTTADGPRVFRYPVREIESLRGRERRVSDRPVAGEVDLQELSGELLDIEAEFEVGDAAEVGLILRGQTIAYHVKLKVLRALGEAPLELSDGRLKLRILVDRTSIETFADDGRVSLTSCLLPGADAKQPPKVFAKGGTARLRSLVSHELKSAWK